MPRQTASRPRPLLALTMIAVGLGGGVAAGEVGVRLAGIEYPRVSQRDMNRGTAYRPGITFQSTGEGGALVSINAEGFRDVDHAVVAAPGTVRIAVVGDSYVDATAVAADARFGDRLPEYLQASGFAGNRAVEVFNFGTSGYGTAQELQVLRHHVWKYRPDVVILAFLPFNDLRNNSEPLEGDDGRPYFTLDDRGELVLDESFRTITERNRTPLRRLQYAVVDHLRVAQVAFEARQRWNRRQFKETSVAVGAATGLEMGLDSAAYLPPPDERWAEAWRVTEAMLAQMHREVTAHGASFLLVTLTAGVQVDPDPAVRARYQASLGVDNLFYAERRVGALCAREGMHCLALGETMQRRATETGAYYHGFPNTVMGRGHWNETGHALAGQLIARALVEQGLIRQ
jgi:lysophospholipase L1-like esterase